MRTEVESWLQDCPYSVQLTLPTQRNQDTGKMRPCNVKDVIHKPPVKYGILTQCFAELENS